MEQKNFEQVWEQLRLALKNPKQGYTNYLEQIIVENIRGIKHLKIDFNYPVTVIAGPNSCGKTTVLFAAACAYQPTDSERSHTPAALFPNLNHKQHSEWSDSIRNTAFHFSYKTKQRMKWSKGVSWNRSFFGEKSAEQPKSQVYLRTLSDLSNPSEVRAVLQINKQPNLELEVISSDLLALAQRVLPVEYGTVVLIKKNDKNLLFVQRNDENGGSYSEFHMSGGERSILRISKDISKLKNALVLIDEIEIGLHPFTQSQLMLELQRIALRNKLQIIVTTHSPVILETVPKDARVFLERVGDNVIEKPAQKPIIQKAFYGQSTDKLSILCEDNIGEYFVLGVLDYLNPKINLAHDDISVGRDTGKTEFATHIKALGKFKKLNEFVFVLDGDAKDMKGELQKEASKVQPTANIEPLFLPGADIPETWAWEILMNNTQSYAQLLGLETTGLNQKMQNLDLSYNNASGKPTEISKNKFHALALQLKRKEEELIRIIARTESAKETGEIKIFADELERQIQNWQNRQ